MKVAVLSESSADEAAIRVIVNAILGIIIEEVVLQTRARRGWPSVRDMLSVVLPALHYYNDAEGLVIIADSDDSPVHHRSHEEVGAEQADCRLCQLRSVVASVQAKLRVLPGRNLIKIGIGVAVPAIEAWYRCGLRAYL